MSDTIRFTVYGTPRPAGSKKTLPLKNRKTGEWLKRPNGSTLTVTMDMADNKDWKQAISHAARQAYDGELLRGPLRLSVVFRFARPKCHYGTGRNASRLKGSAPAHHTKSPDATKLLRCCEDALNRVIWADDAQIVGQEVTKCWGEPAGCIVEIHRVDETLLPLLEYQPTESKDQSCPTTI